MTELFLYIINTTILLIGKQSNHLKTYSALSDVSTFLRYNNMCRHAKTSFEKNCFSAWASTLNMGLINKVDMVCRLWDMVFS